MNKLEEKLALIDAELKTLKQQCKLQQQQLGYMQNSLSWKITQPARTILQLFNKICKKCLTVSKEWFDQNACDRALAASTLLPKITDESIKNILTYRVDDKCQKYDVICFASSDWNCADWRTQKFLAKFAQHGHRVFFVTSENILNLRSDKNPIDNILPNIYQVNVMSHGNTHLLAKSLEELRADFKIENAVSYLMLPGWRAIADLAHMLWGWTIISDKLSKIKIFRSQYLKNTSIIKQNCPLVSIIVISYNNLAYTKMCLESIIKNTEYANYEIIVVDNNSADETPTYLRYMANRFQNIRLILNEVNHGFAKANNQALAQSKAEYLVLLNNDTAVPPGWLDRLIWHLRDPKVGLVGPVTNQIGNEAKIEVTYKTIEEMYNFSKQYTWDHEDQIKDIPMLAMFCVAMRADVYKEIGNLDEQFGIGMFEDDDYSYRMRQAGYKVICAHDVYIHHVGQGSFIKLIESGEYNELFERNKKLFERKWQIPWQHNSPKPLIIKQSSIARQLSSDSKIGVEG